MLGPRRYILGTRHNNFPVRGTLWEDMSEFLFKQNLSKNTTTNIDVMKQSLENGDALIVMISYPDQKIYKNCRIDAHYIFVYVDKNNRIMIVNEDRKYFNSWETFEKTYLQNNPTDADGNIYPRGWVVKKARSEN